MYIRRTVVSNMLTGWFITVMKKCLHFRHPLLLKRSDLLMSISFGNLFVFESFPFADDLSFVVPQNVL